MAPAVGSGSRPFLGSSSIEPMQATTGPMPSMQAPANGAVLTIVTNTRDEVIVDKATKGRGPSLTVMVEPGVHEIVTRRVGEEQWVVIAVRSGEAKQIDMRGPWRR